MAYTHPSLHRIGPSNSDVPTLWMYSSTDAQSVIRAVGYFDDASDDLNVNDVIIIASATGGTPVLSISYVNANSGGSVDITDGLTITATDSD